MTIIYIKPDRALSQTQVLVSLRYILVMQVPLLPEIAKVIRHDFISCWKCKTSAW